MGLPELEETSRENSGAPNTEKARIPKTIGGIRVLGWYSKWKGSVEETRLFLEGQPPHLTGTPHNGLNGDETIIIWRGIFPIKTFYVNDHEENKG